jgi:hypothetical protein
MFVSHHRAYYDMEIYTIEQDIAVLCVKATSFPEGVMGAFETLRSLLPSMEGRTIYGLSYPDGKGGLIYKAAANETFEGEAEKLGCETFIIKKGKYMSERLNDYMKDTSQFAKIFQQLLTADIEPHTYCLEIYLNEKDALCLVKLKP